MNKKKPPNNNLWFPSLLQTANNINSNSWFNILEKRNNNVQQNAVNKINTLYTRTMKYIIYPTNEQKIILNKWFRSVIKMYNITNKYIKNKIINGHKLETFITIRKKLLQEAKHIIKKTKVTKHTLDYAIKHCVEMYKSAFSNLKNDNIKNFDIKNMSYNKNRYNLVIEPANFSKKINGFFVSSLGKMDSQKSLINLCSSNSILQYNKNSNKYYIITPYEYYMKYNIKRESKCGIDLGVRTFATVYSKNRTLEIGTNIIKKIDSYNNKIDKIKSDLANKIISKEKYKKILLKYGNKMRNRIDDLHKKLATYLMLNFKEINIGKISTSKIISNLTGNIKEITKRRALTLKFYRFMELLKIMAIKYDNKLTFVNEYKTSKTCHNCMNEHKKLGSNKIYKCVKCKIEIDRDINASINIYLNRSLN